jgi:thiamine biosynthesis lipoprotein
MTATYRLSVTLMLLLAISVGARAENFTFNHENVLGTSLELRVNADTQAAADAAEAAGLKEIDRLNKIFSTYDRESELSQFLSAPIGKSLPISRELASALALCEHWIAATRGAFHPAAELFTREWQQAAEDGKVPTKERLAELVAQHSQPAWRLDAAKENVERTSDAPLSLNALAKGMMIDRVADMALASGGVHGVLVNIGGDLRVAGDMTSTVAIPQAAADAIGSVPAATITVAGGGVATSGGSERHFGVAGRRYSHIIDPRTGQPAAGMAAATVIAADAATADVLATACCVLATEESLALVAAQTGAKCLLQTADGRTVASPNWPQTTAPKPALSPAAERELVVEFEIARAGRGGRYRRPYVAVWIEDDHAFPVRTLLLFLMTDGPGPRWHRDLRRWYRGDQLRRLVDQQDLIATVSKPTRNPGQYKVVWDGADDHGKPVSPGKFTLYIEAAREHGTYQLMKHEFDLGTSFDVELKPNAEIGSAKIHYVVESAPQ